MNKNKDQIRNNDTMGKHSPEEMVEPPLDNLFNQRTISAHKSDSLAHTLNSAENVAEKVARVGTMAVNPNMVSDDETKPQIKKIIEKGTMSSRD